MKQVVFMGNALARLKDFPPGARQDTGFQIDKVQRGETPDDWKPMRSIGKSVREIRINEKGGQFRIVYVVGRDGLAYVLHAFQKKTRQTRKSDIDLARKRLMETEVNDG
jgi:phage-related protein